MGVSDQVGSTCGTATQSLGAPKGHVVVLIAWPLSTRGKELLGDGVDGWAAASNQESVQPSCSVDGMGHVASDAREVRGKRRRRERREVESEKSEEGEVI